MSSIKKVLLFLIFSILFIKPILSVSITEIMYNPKGSDTNREWIEIYANCENITKYKLYEAETNHNLNLVNGSSYLCGYAIISQDPNSFLEEYPKFNGTLIDSTFSLSNTNETIEIRNSSLILDNLTYYSTQSASGNGMSLCKINLSWEECDPTPGYAPQEILTGYVKQIIDGDTFELSTNESVRLIGIDTPERGDYYYLEAKNRLKELIEGKQIKLTKDIENRDDYNRLLRYVYIDDNFINLILIKEGYAEAWAYGSNIKFKDNFTIAENEAKENKIGLWINISNIENISQYSYLKIKEIYLGSDKKAKFGDSIRVKINVHRGDSTKEVVYIYASDNQNLISKKASITLDKKFVNYTLTIPLQLIPNCNLKYPEKHYNLILEGLGLKTEESFEVSGINKELCKTNSNTEINEDLKEKSTLIKQALEEDLDIETEKNINASKGIIYNSTNIEEKRYAIYFLSFVLVLLIIKLLVKNGN